MCVAAQRYESRAKSKTVFLVVVQRRGAWDSGSCQRFSLEEVSRVCPLLPVGRCVYFCMLHSHEPH